jgi:hypothetical protein
MTDTKVRESAASRAPVPAPAAGDNRPSPIRTLRDWLDHPASRDRLAVMRPRVADTQRAAVRTTREESHCTWHASAHFFRKRNALRCEPIENSANFRARLVRRAFVA